MGRSLFLVAMIVVTGTLPAQGTRPSADAIAGAVDSLAARVTSSGVSPAIGVAVVMDGKTIYAKSHGWADVTKRVRADDRTLWYLASTSKSLTGSGGAAHWLGAFKLSDPIGALLPAVRWPRELTPRA
jgi:CubicO group peptidase (beta-lactamase class C family)